LAQVDGWLNHWFEQVCETAGLDPDQARADWLVPGHLLDALPRNMIEGPDASRFIDLEWRSTVPLTLGQLVVRAVLHELAGMPPVARPSDGVPLGFMALASELSVWRRIGLDRAAAGSAWTREVEFQRAAMGTDRPISAQDVLDGALRLRVDCDELVRRADAFPEDKATLARLHEILAERDAALAETAAQLSAAREQTQRLAREFDAEREQAAATLRAAVSEGERGIRAVMDALATERDLHSQTAAWAAARDQAAIAEAQATRRLAARVNDLRTRVRRLRSQVNGLDRRLAEEKKLRRQILTSRSWRWLQRARRAARPWKR
jgi:hypothetical protein